MTLSSPASFTHARELEVRLLVDMVRLSRVTLLIAEPGAEKSVLLRSSVVPLLTDRAHGTPADVTILFDAWETAPLPALRSRIREAVAESGADAAGDAGAGSLAATLHDAQDALESKFVIIFDRFEDYLRTPSGRVGFADFENEFVQAVNDPTLRAHFLLAVDDGAEPLLARLRERIPRLGYSRVRLPGPNGASRVEQPVGAAPVQASPSLSMRIAPLATPNSAAPSPGARGAMEDTAADEPRSKPTSIEILAAAKAAKDMAWRAPRPRGDDAQPSAKAPARSRTDETQPVAKAPPRSRGDDAQTAAKVPPRVVTPMAAEPTALRAPEPVQTGRAAEAVGASPAEPSKPADVIASKAPDSGHTGVGRKAPADAAAAPQREPRTGPSARSDAEDIALRPRARRVTRIAWVPVALAIFAVFVFLQPRTQQIVERAVNSLRGAESVSTGEGAVAEVAKSRGPATPSSAGADAPAVAPGPAPAAVTPSPARTAEEGTPRIVTAPPSAKPPQVAAVDPGARTAEVPRAQPAAAAPTPSPRQIESGAPEAARKSEPPAPAAKPASTAAAPVATPRRDVAAAAAASPQVARQTEARASKPAAPASGRPTESVANSAVASAPPAAAEATVPGVYIHVRSEAQRAWAEQHLVRPLTARGFRVMGIRVVPTGPEVADIRYYHLAQRDEAIRIGVALRDSGVGAQHLKQLEDSVPAAPARQYEVWLPATP